MMQPKLAGNVSVFGRQFAWTLAALSSPHCRTTHSPHSIHSYYSATGPASSQLSSTQMELNNTSRTAFSRQFYSFSTSNSGQDELDKQGQRKKEEMEKRGLAKGRWNNYETLYMKHIKMDRWTKLKLVLHGSPNANGHRYFKFSTLYTKGNLPQIYFHDGPKIILEEGYKLVRALDKLVVAIEDKRHWSRKQNAHSQPIADWRPLADNVLATEEFDSELYRYELQLYYSQRDSLRCLMIAHPKNPIKRKREISLPATAMLGVRMILANLLEEFDGSQKLDIPKIDETSPLAFGISRQFFSSASNSSEDELELEKQKHEQGKETEESGGLAADGEGKGKGTELVDKKYIGIGRLQELTVKLDKRADGELIFQIYKAWKEQEEDNLIFKWKFYSGPRINIAEAYNTVRALDKLMAALVEEHGRGKSQEANPKLNDGRLAENNNIIASEVFDGQYYKHELQLFYENEFLLYRIIGLPKNLDWAKRVLSLPAESIFEFRMALAGLLEKYDGSQRLEMPELKLLD